MKRVANAALIAAMITISGQSMAATWKFAAGGSSGTLAQFDEETFRIAGDVVTVWIAYDFSRQKIEPARSAKSKVELNCKAWTARTISITRYSADGRTIQDARTPSIAFEDIIPESFGDEMATSICAYAKVRAQTLHY